MKLLRYIPLIILLLFSAILLSSCSDECLHVAMTDEVIVPSCSDEGKTVRTCSSCGYSYECAFIAPLGHTLLSQTHVPTCDAPGYTEYVCVCGYSYTTDHVKPLGHTLTETKTAPTCDKEGHTEAKCSVCNYSYIYNVTAPTGHTFTKATTHVSANQQCGSTKYTCACGFSYVGDYTFYSDIYRGAYVESTTVLAKGLDTSKHNHKTDANGNYLPLDWNAIKAAGFDFVILRVGYIGVKDPVFEMDYAAAKAAGLDVGVYFYTYADSVEEAREEALCCLDFIKDKSFEYPIFFDIEEDRLGALGADTLTSICIEFISTIQQNGYFGALYSNNNWLVNKLHKDKLTTLFDVWYARYPTLSGTLNEAEWNFEKYGTQMVMWQFSKTGTINGFLNNDGEPMLFDLNYAYKDYPTIIKELGYNNLEK